MPGTTWPLGTDHRLIGSKGCRDDEGQVHTDDYSDDRRDQRQAFVDSVESQPHLGSTGPAFIGTGRLTQGRQPASSVKTTVLHRPPTRSRRGRWRRLSGASCCSSRTTLSSSVAVPRLARGAARERRVDDDRGRGRSRAVPDLRRFTSHRDRPSTASSHTSRPTTPSPTGRTRGHAVQHALVDLSRELDPQACATRATRWVGVSASSGRSCGSPSPVRALPTRPS